MKIIQLTFLLIFAAAVDAAQPKGDWKKHVIWEGQRNNVAVAADFTGDGKVDVISSNSGKTRLFVAPDWKQVIIGDDKDHTFIHGETFDVDEDGDAESGAVLGVYGRGLTAVWRRGLRRCAARGTRRRAALQGGRP